MKLLTNIYQIVYKYVAKTKGFIRIIFMQYIKEVHWDLLLRLWWKGFLGRSQILSLSHGSGVQGVVGTRNPGLIQKKPVGRKFKG